ncbi:MAG: hypothetical protein PWR20_1258 [Bacteroidales bacterium]|jgi:hypothetical protein|nr:hypothetical protein [Bacteroidales bacterium]MDN5330338.1 hypothetical protein [Bacteroidales bacterium]NLH52533.1 DUF4492 domain-containing protein [Bacteroidales bacterium]NPV36738.1 DUF4492 domain-containing protein [Bacteroidales bacterium]
MLKRVIRFYIEGFRSMTVGKTLWAIILLKLFIMFAVFRLFFFKPYLKEKFPDDKSRAKYVTEQLTRKPL